MKLYTEEQVKKAIKMALDGFCIHGTEDTIEVVASKFTPIELPSDEDIEQISNEYALNIHPNPTMITWRKYTANDFVKGAKMVIDKIQGGNNEQ